MARLGFAVGGSVLGGFLGGPLGAKIGFLAGAYLGGRLFGDADAVEGPRKTDLSVQAASYGTPWPIHYGTNRIAGQLQWVQGNKLIEVEREESGKGTGPAFVNYEYFATFAVGLCEGPITGVRRIWADTTLIYDIGQSDIADQIAADAGVQSNAQLPGVNIQIYTGTATQLPDPSIEAEKGVGKTPAYRGRAYMVFDFLNVDTWGRIPNITAEVVANGTEQAFSYEIKSTGIPSSNRYTKSRYDDLIWLSGGGRTRKIDVTTGAVVVDKDWTGLVDKNAVAIALGAGAAEDDSGFFYATGSGALEAPLYKFESNTFSLVDQAGSYSTGGMASSEVGVWVFSFRPGRRWFISIGLSVKLNLVDLDDFATGRAASTVNLGGLSDDFSHPDMREVVPGLHYEIGISAQIGGVPKFVQLTVKPQDDPSNSFTWKITRVDTDLSASVSGAIVGRGCMYYADDNTWIVHNADDLVKLDADTLAVLASNANVAGWDSGPFWYGYGAQDGKTYLSNGATLKEIDLADLAVLQTWDMASLWLSATWTAVGFVPAEQAFIADRQSGGNSLFKLYLPRLDPLDITVRSIIEDVSTRVGLPAASVDATAVTATTRGYTLRKAITGRAALESVLDYYFIRGADFDRKVNFVPLGQAADIVIDADDLGAGVGAPADSEGARLMTQETELPRVLNVGYADFDMDYDPNVQPYHRPREVVGSREIVNRDYAIVSFADEAAQVAEKMVFSRWAERLRITVQLPRKYKQIAPLTVITVPLGGKNYDVRVESLTETQILKAEGPVQRAATYVSNAVGKTGQIPIATIPIFSDSLAFVLDVNALRDVDDTLGYYIGVAPKKTNGVWAGAQVDKSDDGLAFDNVIYSSSTPVVWGFAETALPDHTETIFDRTNTLTVRMINGSLASVTETNVLDGQNHALLKSGDRWEILGFADVVDNGDGTFDLSTLLRGRRGTDDFSGGHIFGDTFLLLNAATLGHLITSADLNVPRAFKATTFGAFVDPTRATWLTHAGDMIKPYSPALVAGSRNGGNDLTVTWMRRSRFNLNGLNFGLLPLGEASESYEVDVLDGGGSVLRTIAATSETASYTAAEQTTDGLTPGDPVDLRLYQLGAVIGRGHPRDATV